MVLHARSCAGLWAVDVATHHRCAGFVPAIVWGMWLASFACMTFALPRFERAPLRTLLVCQILAGLAFVVTPMLPTADPYAYHVYGAASTLWDPWHPTVLVAHREALTTGLRIWGNPPFPSPYGPLFVAYERLLLAVFPAFSADQLIYVERSISLGAVVAITVMLRGPRIAYWALNPLVLYEFALAAHCDVLMLLLIAVAIRLRNPLLAGVAIGCSGLIKVVGLGAGAFRLAALPTALATVVIVLLIQPHAASVGPLIAASGFSGSPGLIVASLAKRLLAAQHLDTVVRFVLLAIGIAVALVVRVARRDAPVYATLLLLACSSWIVPWYLTWVVFAARYAHRTTTIAVIWIAAASMLLEAHNQTGAAKTELLAAIAFLVSTAIALCWAWKHGAAPRLAFRRLP